METTSLRGTLLWFSEKEGCGILKDEEDHELFLRNQERAETFGANPQPGQTISFRTAFCDRLGRQFADDWRVVA